MSEESQINFCPYCDAARHKLLGFKENELFCRECNRFFNCNQVFYSCPKCSSKKIVDSDFPSPGGEIVFQCRSCKKMFTAKDLFGIKEKEEVG